MRTGSRALGWRRGLCRAGGLQRQAPEAPQANSFLLGGLHPGVSGGTPHLPGILPGYFPAVPAAAGHQQGDAALPAWTLYVLSTCSRRVLSLSFTGLQT